MTPFKRLEYINKSAADFTPDELKQQQMGELAGSAVGTGGGLVGGLALADKLKAYLQSRPLRGAQGLRVPKLPLRAKVLGQILAGTTAAAGGLLGGFGMREATRKNQEARHPRIPLTGQAAEEAMAGMPPLR